MNNEFSEFGGAMEGCCQPTCCSGRFGGGCFNTTAESLCSNIGRVVTIFTDSGGMSGCGFTGLLVWGNDCFIKLLTTLPSAPAYPFKGRCNSGCCFNWNQGACGCCSRNGTAMLIPVCHIVSFVFDEV